MEHRFENSVAIVTGAASGIGLATAKRFASEGATVVIADRDTSKLATAVQAVEEAGKSKGRVWGSTCDVSQESDVSATFQGTLQRFAKVDIIVNNAGLMIFKALEDHSIEDWNRVLSVDLLGAFLMTREAFRGMPSGGVIVNVSSIHAIETTPLVAAYAAAKSALLSLTRSSAIEGKDKGIRVNAILPGAIDTPMLWTNPNVKSGKEVVLKVDVGTDEQVAAAIAFLASNDSSFIQGVSLRVDGGRLNHL